MTLKVEAQGYMNHVNQADVRTRGHARRPHGEQAAEDLAREGAGQRDQDLAVIHFETDSAKILGDRTRSMEEIADVLQRNPNIRKVEIQGHTDNTGRARAQPDAQRGLGERGARLADPGRRGRLAAAREGLWAGSPRRAERHAREQGQEQARSSSSWRSEPGPPPGGQRIRRASASLVGAGALR